MSDEQARVVDPESVDMEVEYLDLDAFIPKPYKKVKVLGVDYDVMHPSDLTFDQWTEMLGVDQQLAKIRDDPGAAVGAGKTKVKMLIPDLPQDVLDSLNPKRILMLMKYVSTEVRTEAERQAAKLEAERGNGDAEAAPGDESGPAPSSSTSAN